MWLVLCGLASAEEPADKPELKVHGWAEAGLEVDAAPETEAAYGAVVTMARLQGRYGTDTYGGVLQVEAKTGQVVLLDAVARAGRADGPHLQAGKFKTPLRCRPRP